MEAEAERLTAMRERQLSVLEEIYFNGHPQQRLPGNLNISVGAGRASRLSHQALGTGGTPVLREALSAYLNFSDIQSLCLLRFFKILSYL